MIIYEAEMSSNNGDWGGSYSHHICFAISEELATIKAIKYMTDRYPEFNWIKEKVYITDKTNPYYPRYTWYSIKAIKVRSKGELK